MNLQAIEEIKQLKARYFRFLDTKKWNDWGALFTPDANLKVDVAIKTWGGEPRIRHDIDGRDAIVAMVSELLREKATVHHGHTPDIEILSETSARGIWAMEDVLEKADWFYNGYGHYHETYERIGRRWYIKTLLLTRLHEIETYGRRLAAPPPGSAPSRP
jgi:hypothetical protein